MGFKKGALQKLLLKEHLLLMGAGVALGLVSGLAASLPAMLSPGLNLPLIPILLVTAGVALNGLIWVYLSSRIAMSGELLTPLREE